MVRTNHRVRIGGRCEVKEKDELRCRCFCVGEKLDDDAFFALGLRLQDLNSSTSIDCGEAAGKTSSSRKSGIEQRI
jgi:hypothetical protein